MTLPPFDHVAVNSLEEAASLLGEQKARSLLAEPIFSAALRTACIQTIRV
jgi:hypothetical protein